MNTSYSLKNYISMENLNWSELCKNPNAIEILEQNENRIDWISFAENPNGYNLMKRYKDQGKIPSFLNLNNNFANDIFISKHEVNVFYSKLCKNPNFEIFIEFIKPVLERYFEIYKKNKENDESKYDDEEELNEINVTFNMNYVFANPHAVECIKQHINFNDIVCVESEYEGQKYQDFNHPDIDCSGLTGNTHPEIIEILENNNVMWDFDITSNPIAINLIKRRVDYYTNILDDLKRKRAKDAKKKYAEIKIKLETYFEDLLLNPTKEAIDIILEYYEHNINKMIKINYQYIYGFARNPFGLEVIETILKKQKLTEEYINIDVCLQLAKNPNPRALELIFKNKKIISIINSVYGYKHQIYKTISSNPCIFEEHQINLK